MKLPPLPPAAQAALRLGLQELGLAARRAIASGVGSLVKDAKGHLRPIVERLGEIESNADRIARERREDHR
jgi:hypothetical protein